MPFLVWFPGKRRMPPFFCPASIRAFGGEKFVCDSSPECSCRVVSGMGSHLGLRRRAADGLHVFVVEVIKSCDSVEKYKLDSALGRLGLLRWERWRRGTFQGCHSIMGFSLWPCVSLGVVSCAARRCCSRAFMLITSCVLDPDALLEAQYTTRYVQLDEAVGCLA